MILNFENEEIRNLNSTLETFLVENRRLKKIVEEKKSERFGSIEENLRKFVENFEDRSRKLTEIHGERYKTKCRTRRWICSRDEMKKRVVFLVNEENELRKILKEMEKLRKTSEKEIEKLKIRRDRSSRIVAKEKENHVESMKKLDELKIDLEKIRVERSRSEVRREEKEKEVFSFSPFVSFSV